LGENKKINKKTKKKTSTVIFLLNVPWSGLNKSRKRNFRNLFTKIYEILKSPNKELLEENDTARARMFV
jgi:hypothetical protein